MCKTQSVVLCSSPVNVWGECKQRVDDDPNEDPNGIVEVGEAVSRSRVLISWMPCRSGWKTGVEVVGDGMKVLRRR